jgi:phosphatidylglycerophosphate synthase
MERYDDADRPLKYRYRSENRSLVDRFLLRHWWEVAIRAIPLRMPANLVTILGSVFFWLSFLILSGALFGPMSSAGRQRPWLFGLVALGIFLYQTLDAIDGIQARRTRAQGPLGEFLDHWFDSMNASLIPLGAVLAFPSVPLPIAAVIIVLYFVAGWLVVRGVTETETLVFPELSTEEGLVVTQLFYLSVWILGYDFWAKPFAFGLPPLVILFALFGFSLLATAIQSWKYIGTPGPFLAGLAQILPMIAWMLLLEAKTGWVGLLVGGIAVGASCSRLLGDLLRVRLIGLAYPLFRPGLFAAGALGLASVLAPGLPSWTILSSAALVLVYSLVALALQLGRTISRVKTVTGIGFWGRAEGAR